MPEIRSTLYAFALSPYVLKVITYLKFKRIQPEIIYVHPAKAKSILPVGSTVPVLTVDGASTSESTSESIRSQEGSRETLGYGWMN